MLLIDDVFLWNVVQQLVIATQRHGTRDLVDARDILRADLFGADRHDAGRAARGNVLPGDPARDVIDARARHPFGVFECGGDGPHRLVDVAHHATPHAAVFREPDAEDLRQWGTRQVARDLRDDPARLGAAEIESGDEAALGH